MEFDISSLLEQWEYQPGQVMVRKFTTPDGVEKIQLRLDLGLLQMNAEGRPDGKRPHDMDSLLDYHQARLGEYLREHGGHDDEFELDDSTCMDLQLEALQYHHRFLCLFQLEDYAGVIRDADRSLAIFDFIAEYAKSDELAGSVIQFRPQLRMMLARAQGTLALQAGNHAEAVRIIQAALEDIRDLFAEHDREDMIEDSDEIAALEAWMEEIESQRPRSRREQLERDLAAAIQREDYEKAALYRDALKRLNDKPPAS
ncbi:MAG TPA: UvrB/UvrC motif-containing protein [Candidatus Paceibacterota bacterium]|nr:UvrB/UvrC motif-containing protein [Verrucomicrobiota bacterium]HRY46958.1 UvrB/UvrC motif-containing protein [Candidatus Paceibacterota bacterium]HSA01082.1 UvrB/UvrC motif-containing protein [Candidatus Paceibacterota bacterium]